MSKGKKYSEYSAANCALSEGKFLEFSFVKKEQNKFLFFYADFFYLSLVICVILFEWFFGLQQISLPAKSYLKQQQ